MLYQKSFVSLLMTLKVYCDLIQYLILDTTVCHNVCQWLATGQWFSPVSSINKPHLHDITEILLKVASKLKTKQLTNQPFTVFHSNINYIAYGLCAMGW